MVDTLITIGIVAFVLLRAYVKTKKKMQQQQAKQQREARQTVRPASMEKPLRQEMQEPSVAPMSYEEIPKNQSYFTYETIEPEIKQEAYPKASSSGEAVEKNVQNIDIEDEKNLQISLEKEDIYKGIIYSEILKRPYN